MFTSAPPITKMHQKALLVWFKATSVKIWNLVLITFIWSVTVNVWSLILSAILKSHCLPLNMFYKYTAWPKRSRHLDLTKLLSISLSLDNYCSDYLMQLATCAVNKQPHHKTFPVIVEKIFVCFRRLLVCSTVTFILLETPQNYRETPTMRQHPMSKHLVTVGRKKSLLTGRNLQ